MPGKRPRNVAPPGFWGATPEESATVAAGVRRALARLPAGSTCCPGELARRLGRTQAALRPVLAQLAAAGEVRITQRGQTRDLATLRGPYRVGPGR